MGFNPMQTKPPLPRPSPTSRFSDDDHFNLVDTHIREIVKGHMQSVAQLIEQQRDAINTLIAHDRDMQVRIRTLEKSVLSMNGVHNRDMDDTIVALSPVSVKKDDGDDRRKRMQEKIRGAR